jgi:hypothetical protein
MGATLKGVSRTMATLSKPYRLWSVRISGARRLQEFERVMAKVGVKFRTVRHFFFSDCVLEQGKPPRGKHYTECIVHASDAPDLKSFGSESTWKITTNQHALGTIKRDLLSRVLAYISQYLKSLVFIFTASEALDAMSRHTFGSLQSIKIYMIDSNLEDSAIPHRMRMPALRTLWLGTSNKMSSTAPTAYCISFVRLVQEYSDVLESVVLDGVAVYADTRYVLRHLLGRPDIKLVPPPCRRTFQMLTGSSPSHRIQSLVRHHLLVQYRTSNSVRSPCTRVTLQYTWNGWRVNYNHWRRMVSGCAPLSPLR